MDNAPEMTSKAMFLWSLKTGVRLRFIQPSTPMQNGSVESLNGRSLRPAHRRHDTRPYYSPKHPPSERIGFGGKVRPTLANLEGAAQMGDSFPLGAEPTVLPQRLAEGGLVQHGLRQQLLQPSVRVHEAHANMATLPSA